MRLVNHFTKNIIKSKPSVELPYDVRGETLVPLNLHLFIKHLRVYISYLCRHPQRVVEKLEELKGEGLTWTIQDLYRLTDNIPVWHGTIGEVIATVYVKKFTDFKVPVFKLRLVPNRRMAMHGDDILGFKFTDKGEPEELLVVEAKNWVSSPVAALKKANETLLKVKDGTPTLFDFIINTLDEQRRFNLAKIVERFLNQYTYTYPTKYLAFIVTEKDKWKEKHYQKIGLNPATPLEIVIFAVPQWQKFQNLLFHPEEKSIAYSDAKIEISDLNEVSNLLENENFKRDHSHLASSVLTAQLKVGERERIRYRLVPEKLENAARFLLHSALRISNENNKSEIWLKEAASLYERLSIWKIEQGEIADAIKNLINGALIYSLAGYNANASVLVGTVTSSPMEEYELPFSDTLYNFSTLLLSGNLSELDDGLAKFFFEVDNSSSNMPDTEEEWAELLSQKISYTGDWLVGQAYANLVYFIKTGQHQHAEKSLKLLHSSLDLYASIGEYNNYYLAVMLNKYFDNLIQNSPQTLVKDVLRDRFDNDWKKYLRFLRLGKFPILVLWKSQKDALEGVLSDENLVISMPTSSGKTRIAELAVFDSLKRNPESRCVYIVPTRALALEVEEALSRNLGRMGIKVSILYGGYDFSPVEEDIIAENRVLVLTPEKFDLLLRQNEDFKNSIKLIVVDEAHETASSNIRSFREELILSRVFYTSEKNTARVLLLSAVIKNLSDFAIWISENAENSVNIEWRPTKQRFGLFQWYQNFKAQVWYPPLPNEYPIEDFYVPLLFNKTDLITTNSNNVEIAARLSLYYSHVGSTLVFTTTKNLVEQISEVISDLSPHPDSEIPPEQEKLSKMCEEILGEDHKLIGYIRQGFCYHHGNLPIKIRRILERAIKDEIIPLIVSTTTLVQGVNLPIMSVIVHSLSLYNKITMSQFWNAVGRAGRAGYETEGHIIFCYNKDLKRVLKETKEEKSESFIFSGLKALVNAKFPSIRTLEEFIEKWALASTNQFRKDGNSYDSWGNIKKGNAEKNKEEILSILDSQLLAFAIEQAIEEFDEQEFELLFDKMLFSIQSLDIEEESKKFKQGLRKRFLAIRNAIPDTDKRILYNRTGLGLSSNNHLSNVITGLKEDILSLDSNQKVPKEIWKKLYTEISKISEFAGLSNIKLDVLLDWVEGKDYKEIAKKYYENNVEKAVKNIEKLTYLLPWGLHSLIVHLKSSVAEGYIPVLFTNLPSLVYHGVPTVGAGYAIILGVDNREIAKNLHDLYIEQYGEISSFKVFKDWLRNLDYSDWVNFLGKEDNFVKECYDGIKNKITYEDRTQITLEFDFREEIDRDIPKEDLIVVKLNEEYWLSTYDYKIVAKLMGLNLLRLKEIDRQKKDLIVIKYDKANKKTQINIV